MIFWIILVTTLVISVIVYASSYDKSNVAIPLAAGVFSLLLLTLVTGTSDVNNVLSDPSQTTITELNEVSYELDPSGEIRNGYELEFIYVSSDGTSKTFSQKVDVISFSGGKDEITIYEKDYSYGNFWVPWGTGAKVTEAVVR